METEFGHKSKGHNSETNIRKIMRNYPKADRAKVNAYIKLVKFYQLVLKILSGNEVLA